LERSAPAGARWVGAVNARPGGKQLLEMRPALPIPNFEFQKNLGKALLEQ